MFRRLIKAVSGVRRRTDGGVSVEFALLLPVFMVFLGGILDFGHAWYMKQVVTNASREGARYGVTYQTNTSGVRIKPNAKSPTIQTVVNNYMNNLLPADASPTVTCGGTGYAAANPSGLPINVSVTAIKHWWIISGFIPGLGSSKTITVATTMNCE